MENVFAASNMSSKRDTRSCALPHSSRPSMTTTIGYWIYDRADAGPMTSLRNWEWNASRRMVGSFRRRYQVYHRQTMLEMVNWYAVVGAKEDASSRLPCPRAKKNEAWTPRPASDSQTVWSRADLPTPGAPLTHMMPLNPAPRFQIQFVAISRAALRVSGWHLGAGYLSPAFRRASKATISSSDVASLRLCELQLLWNEKSIVLLASLPTSFPEARISANLDDQPIRQSYHCFRQRTC